MPVRDFAQILPMAFEKHKAIAPLIGMLDYQLFNKTAEVPKL